MTYNVIVWYYYSDYIFFRIIYNFIIRMQGMIMNCKTKSGLFAYRTLALIFNTHDLLRCESYPRTLTCG